MTLNQGRFIPTSKGKIIWIVSAIVLVALAGGLSASMQVAIGSIRLDETDHSVSAEQARELLPLWETLRDLESSDTTAQEEKDALITQIQETMTKDQMQAITSLNLTRQDMFSIMQSQGLGSGSQTTQNGNSSSNRTFNGGDGFAGGPPPEGGFPGGGPGFFQGQGQGSSRTTQSNSSTQTSNQRVTIDPDRVPTSLIQAVIEYLKKKAGAE